MPKKGLVGNGKPALWYARKYHRILRQGSFAGATASIKGARDSNEFPRKAKNQFQLCLTLRIYCIRAAPALLRGCVYLSVLLPLNDAYSQEICGHTNLTTLDDQLGRKMPPMALLLIFKFEAVQLSQIPIFLAVKGPTTKAPAQYIHRWLGRLDVLRTRDCSKH